MFAELLVKDSRDENHYFLIVYLFLIFSSILSTETDVTSIIKKAAHGRSVAKVSGLANKAKRNATKQVENNTGSAGKKTGEVKGNVDSKKSTYRAAKSLVK